MADFLALDCPACGNVGLLVLEDTGEPGCPRCGAVLTLEVEAAPSLTPAVRTHEEIPLPESLQPAPVAVEPKSTTKATVAKWAGIVASVAVAAQVLLPNGLWDTIAHVVELVAKAIAGS